MIGRFDEACQYGGAIWLFSGPETRRKFSKNPRRYAPQYNAYVRDGISPGMVLQPGRPPNPVVKNGRLYLFATKQGAAAFDAARTDPFDEIYGRFARPLLRLPFDLFQSDGLLRTLASPPVCTGGAEPLNSLGRQQVASRR